MTGDRRLMTRVLKDIVVPRIRARGFAGSFPYFRRKHGSNHQLVMFGFHRDGGSFYVEAGQLPDSQFQELQERWSAKGKKLAEEDLDVGHCRWNQRRRLGGAPGSDPWFKFGPNRFQGDISPSPPRSGYEDVATRVIQAIESELEPFFDSAA